MDGTDVWTKLPGQFVKLGTTRRPFETLVPKREWARTPVAKRERIAAAQFLRSQAKGELAFVRHPIYTVWAEKVMRQTDAVPVVTLRLPEEPWKVSAVGSGELSPPAVEPLVEQTARRYGVQGDDVFSLMALIARSPLFCWLQHPLLLQMAYTDYA